MKFTRLTLALGLLLSLLVSTADLRAQSGDIGPTLREVPEGSNPQRHLLQSVYENAKYPKVAREAKRSGTYILAITVGEDETTWDVYPPAELPAGAQPVNLIIKGTDESGGGTVSGQMKVNADRALLEATETVGRYLVDIGFDPAVRQGSPATETVYLALYYKVE